MPNTYGQNKFSKTPAKKPAPAASGLEYTSTSVPPNLRQVQPRVPLNERVEALRNTPRGQAIAGATMEQTDAFARSRGLPPVLEDFDVATRNALRNQSGSQSELARMAFAAKSGGNNALAKTYRDMLVQNDRAGIGSDGPFDRDAYIGGVRADMERKNAPLDFSTPEPGRFQGAVPAGMGGLTGFTKPGPTPIPEGDMDDRTMLVNAAMAQERARLQQVAANRPSADLSATRQAYLDNRASARQAELAGRAEQKGKAREMQMARAQLQAAQRQQMSAARQAGPDPMQMAMLRNPELAVQMYGINAQTALAQAQMAVEAQQRGLDRDARGQLADRELESRKYVADLEARTAKGDIDARNELARIGQEQMGSDRQRDDERALRELKLQEEQFAFNKGRSLDPWDQMVGNVVAEMYANGQRPTPQMLRELQQMRPTAAGEQAAVPGSTTAGQQLPSPAEAQQSLDERLSPGTYEALTALGQTYGRDYSNLGVLSMPWAMGTDLVSGVFGTPGIPLDRRAEYMAADLMRQYEQGKLRDEYAPDIAAALRSSVDPGFIDSLSDPDYRNVGTINRANEMTPARKLLEHVLAGKPMREYLDKLSPEDRRKIRSTSYSTWLRSPQ